MSKDTFLGDESSREKIALAATWELAVLLNEIVVKTAGDFDQSVVWTLAKRASKLNNAMMVLLDEEDGSSIKDLADVVAGRNQ